MTSVRGASVLAGAEPDPGAELLARGRVRSVHWTPGLDPPRWRSWWAGGPGPERGRGGTALPRWCLQAAPLGEVLPFGPDELARAPLARARGLRAAAVLRLEEGTLVVESSGPLEPETARVRALAVHLAASRRRLARQPALAVGEAAAGIAHDLRNQLTLAELECRRLLESSRSDPAAARALEAALRGARELCAALLEDDDETQRRTPLRPVLERELSAALGLCGGGDAPRLELSCPRALEACLRRAAFARCVRNLVLNALQATPAGRSVRVAARAAEPGDLVLEVVDEGPGMSPEALHRCVQPGASGRGSTGLGLASVLACVESLEAELELTSEPGHGTSARLVLAGAVVGGEPRPLFVAPEPGAGPETALAMGDLRAARARLEAGAASRVLAARSLPAEERAALRGACEERGIPYGELGVLSPVPVVVAAPAS